MFNLAVVSTTIEPYWVGIIIIVVVVLYILLSKVEKPAYQKDLALIEDKLNCTATALRKEMSERQSSCYRVKALEDDIKELKLDNNKKFDELKNDMKQGFSDLQKLIIETLRGGK